MERSDTNLSAVSDPTNNDDHATGLIQNPMQSSLLACGNEVKSEDDIETEEDQSSSVEGLDSRGDVCENQREGTIRSARLNILSSMVGGGSLSLPLAFYQAGNGLLAPFLLLCIAAAIDHSIYFLVQAGNYTSKTNATNRKSKGSLSYDKVASAAIGTIVGHLSMALICINCFFGITGYGVLLRDMLLPISDYLSPQNDSDGGDGRPTYIQNAVMVFVVMLITPLCTLESLTALKHIGAASMVSVLILFCCITYRSAECNFSSKYDHVRHMPWKEYISAFPSHDDDEFNSSITATLHQLANAIPILLTVYMCHFNVLPVHNELQDPSPKRVYKLFSTSIGSAAFFYLFMGFVGSMYGNCTESGRVEGNVLLSFAEDDKLLMLGRACLSMTIAFALPVFVLPTRNMFLNGVDSFCGARQEGVDDDDDGAAHSEQTPRNSNTNGYNNPLEEPLLVPEKSGERMTETCRQESRSCSRGSDSGRRRVIVSIAILWLAITIACCVKRYVTIVYVCFKTYFILVSYHSL